MFKTIKYYCWTRPYTSLYAAWAAFKESRHPFRIGSEWRGKIIAGREITRSADGVESLTGLYLKNGNKIELVKLYNDPWGDPI